eukprot:gene14486-biopygen8733
MVGHRSPGSRESTAIFLLGPLRPLVRGLRPTPRRPRIGARFTTLLSARGLPPRLGAGVLLYRGGVRITASRQRAVCRLALALGLPFRVGAYITATRRRADKRSQHAIDRTPPARGTRLVCALGSPPRVGARFPAWRQGVAPPRVGSRLTASRRSVGFRLAAARGLPRRLSARLTLAPAHGAPPHVGARPTVSCRRAVAVSPRGPRSRRSAACLCTSAHDLPPPADARCLRLASARGPQERVGALLTASRLRVLHRCARDLPPRPGAWLSAARRRFVLPYRRGVRMTASHRRPVYRSASTHISPRRVGVPEPMPARRRPPPAGARKPLSFCAVHHLGTARGSPPRVSALVHRLASVRGIPPRVDARFTASRQGVVTASPRRTV